MLKDNTKFSDEDIIEKTRSENQDFYAIIMGRYQRKLVRYATNLINDEDKAVDVVQESFIKAFVNLNGFDTKKKFSSWIYRIVHNEVVNVIKKYHKEVPIPEDMDIESTENIENDFEKRETKEIVERCLEKMPLLYSEPLTLYFIEERSYEEVSDILQIPMGTVAIRISRAKLLMKKLCQKK